MGEAVEKSQSFGPVGGNVNDTGFADKRGMVPQNVIELLYHPAITLLNTCPEEPKQGHWPTEAKRKAIQLHSHK